MTDMLFRLSGALFYIFDGTKSPKECDDLAYRFLQVWKSGDPESEEIIIEQFFDDYEIPAKQGECLIVHILIGSEWSKK